MNITVYLGANEGNDPLLRKAVEELGAWIGSAGNALVYGGSKSGLMGAIADSVLRSGGEVTGVEPRFFIENEFQHEGFDSPDRDRGYVGAQEENDRAGRRFHRLPRRHGNIGGNCRGPVKGVLKHLSAPCILYNLDGYYNDLKALLHRMIEKGLSSEERQAGIYFAENLDEIKRIL